MLQACDLILSRASRPLPGGGGAAEPAHRDRFVCLGNIRSATQVRQCASACVGIRPTFRLIPSPSQIPTAIRTYPQSRIRRGSQTLVCSMLIVKTCIAAYVALVSSVAVDSVSSLARFARRTLPGIRQISMHPVAASSKSPRMHVVCQRRIENEKCGKLTIMTRLQESWGERKRREGEERTNKGPKPNGTRGGKRGNKENTTDLRLLQLQP